MDIDDFVKQLNSVINSSNDTVTPVVTSVTPAPVVSNVIEQPAKKVKILIVSTHVNQVNGYSKVIYNIIQKLSLQPWINVVHFGTQKITNGDLGRKYPTSVKVIDGTAMEKQKAVGFAFNELPNVIVSEKPDIVFIYNDLSVICGYIEEIRKVIQNRFFKIWAYIDTTYKCQPQPLIDVLNRDVERIFCVSF